MSKHRCTYNKKSQEYYTKTNLLTLFCNIETKKKVKQLGTYVIVILVR